MIIKKRIRRACGCVYNYLLIDHKVEEATHRLRRTLCDDCIRKKALYPSIGIDLRSLYLDVLKQRIKDLIGDTWAVRGDREPKWQEAPKTMMSQDEAVERHGDEPLKIDDLDINELLEDMEE